MYKIVSKYGAGRVFCIAIIIMSFVGCLVWQMSCPRCSDDYIYASAPVGGVFDEDEYWNCAGGDYQDFDEIWMTIKGHFSVINSRISNHLYIVVQLLPVPVVKVICGVIVGLMYIMLLRFSLTRWERRRPLYVGIYTLLFWVIFPWYDILQSSVFVFNYPLSAVLILWFISLYRNIDKYGIAGKTGLLLFAFVCGLYHEGFTVPLGAYVFGDIIIRRREVGRGNLWRMAVLAMLVGAVLVMWACGSGSRLSHFGFSLQLVQMWFRWNAKKILVGALPGLVLCGLCVYDLFAHKSTLRALVAKLGPVAFAYFVGLLMCFFLNFYDRAMWGAYVFATAAIMQALVIADIKEVKWGRGVACVGTLIALFYGAWLVELVVWQRRVTAVDACLIKQLEPRNSHFAAIAYADRVWRDDIPFYLMDIPCPVEEIYEYNNKIFSHYWVDWRAERLAVLPEAMRNVPFDSLPTYEGNAGFRGKWPFILSEYPFKGQVEIYGGVYNGKQNPFISLIVGAREVIFDSPANIIQPPIETEPVVLPDSTIIHVALMTRMPITFRYRPILRVDTLERR